MELELFVGVLHQEEAPKEHLEMVCERLQGAAHLHVEKFPPFANMPLPNKIGHETLHRAIDTKSTHVLLVLTDYVPCADFVKEVERAILARPEDILCFTGSQGSELFLPGWYTSADGLVPFCCLPIDVAKDFLAFCDEALNEYGWCGTIDQNIVTYAQMVGVPIYRTTVSFVEGVQVSEVDWTSEPQAFVGRETPDRHWRLITCLRPAFRRVRLAYDLERVQPKLGERLQAIMDKAKKQNQAIPFNAPSSMMAHVRSVLMGEYDFPLLRVEKPRILDLGANLGAFALWAKNRFPGCEIRCYEPHPTNAETLRKNIEAFEIPATVEQVAISVEDGPLKLYDGFNNCGEASLRRGEEQAETFHEVAVIAPEDLPPADLVKIDTEGAEWEIIFGYLFWDTVKAVTLEWHSAQDRERIKEFLIGRGFEVGKDEVRRPDRGILGFVKRAP